MRVIGVLALLLCLLINANAVVIVAGVVVVFVIEAELFVIGVVRIIACDYCWCCVCYWCCVC